MNISWFNRRPRPPVSGLLAASMTPFKGASIDENAFSALVADLIEAGVDGIVTAGLAGEGSTLSEAERERLVALAVEASGGRCPVVAASGSNATGQTIAWSLAARRAGADALLITVPYYNRPSQHGILLHFTAIAEVVDLPILVHDMPDRTGVALDPQTISKLAGVNGIAGFVGKPATLAAVNGRTTVLGADDGDVPAAYFTGCGGGLSLLANLLPRTVRLLHFACGRGDLAQARAVQNRLQPLLDAARGEPEPTLVKAALSCLREDFDGRPRLPLIRPSPDSLQQIELLLAELASFEATLPQALAASRGERRP